MSTRNKLRSAILGSGAKFKAKTVEVNGETYEVREPSQGAFKDILERNKVGDGYSTKLSNMIAIECTFVPGTDEKVFEEGDLVTLDTLPMSSPFNKIVLAASEFLNPEESFEKK